MSSAARPAPVAALLLQAEQARAAGRAAEAAGLAEQILSLDPAEPHALNLLGNQALAAGDPARARALFERAVVAAPDASPLWLNLAIAARDSGDFAAEIAALEKSLALDPYMMLALLQKGYWFERQGEERQASRVYRDVLASAPPPEKLPPPVRTALAHAKDVVAADIAALEASVRATLGTSDGGGRFDRFVRAAVGTSKVYVQQPTGMHFPDLPAIQFYDRSHFPWMAGLEAQTATIRDELVALLAEMNGFVPYVAYEEGRPVNQWDALNHSLDWSAFFLWKDGARVEANCARCPRTAAILEALPMNDIPRRSPSAFFSLLKPGAHIPAHTGVTNTRLIVHLPLVVPEGCLYRVGSEHRAWQEGKAWVFDDTIEHEAWNRSGQVRALLIFDVWNPFLTEAEQDGVRDVTRGMDAHYGSAA